ncbi:MAG: hypothetical protein Q9227_003473 [Pyrenula ochraceoflavens]
MTAHGPYPPPASGPGSFPGSGRSSWNGVPEKRPYGPPSKGYIHMRDIITGAVPDVSRDAPLHTQLHRATNHISSAKRSIEFKRPDLAYKEFLKGFEITVNYIPRHRDFAAYSQKNSNWDADYRDLCKATGGMEPMMEEIRKMIEEDNRQSGVVPKKHTNEGPRNHERSQSLFASGSASDARPSSGASDRKEEFGRQAEAQSRNSLPPSLVAGPPKDKPNVRPKPSNLIGNAVNTPPDGLADRFARLRMPSESQNIQKRDVKIPMPEDFHKLRGLSGSEDRSQTIGPSTNKPLGPRDMPGSNLPTVPPKVPLTPIASALPQAPPPTYSPAKSVAPSSALSGPRSSTEGSRPNGIKKQYYYNQPTSRPGSPLRSGTPVLPAPRLAPKNDSKEIPYDRAISPEKLMEYMRRYNVLLIDVRSRTQFDEGHILSSSIICIEPLSLKAGVSADELEERLVVSPDTEEDLFSRRDQFDVIVYYDEGTSSTDFLRLPPQSSKNIALRALYDTLVEFSDRKPLKDGRPPALLTGGIQGWVDMIGPHSLAQSKTAGVIGSTKRRAAAKAQRQSSLQLRRQRMQSLRPLDRDEAQAWLKKAREDEIDSREFQEEEEETDEPIEVETVEGQPPQSPYVPDYESFLRRFPSINGEPQSMIRPAPSRIPSFEPYETPSFPPAPTRPPPAIPRPSYSGEADTNAPQAPLARQVSATRPALYTSGSISRRNTPLHRTGLENLGNTCYLNATLQCLAATIPLSTFFKSDTYKQFCSMSKDSSQGVVPFYIANIIRHLWKEDRSYYSPRQFVDFMTKRLAWEPGRQQDASELLISLLDMLHEDFNIHHNHTRLNTITPAQEAVRERMQIPLASSIEWERHEHNNRSFIESLFAGQIATRTTCSSCGFHNTAYDVVYTFTLPIPARSGPNGFTLAECLRDYCRPEFVKDWKCEKCNREGGWRQVMLTRLPQFLIIHLMRFGYDKDARRFSKIRSLINYPLYGLNLDEFVYGAHEPPPSASSSSKSEIPDMAVTPPFTFDCYGIVRHHGDGPHSGHYTTLARDFGRGTWRSFNDTQTFDFDPLRSKYRDEWCTSDTYILFYQRVS